MFKIVLNKKNIFLGLFLAFFVFSFLFILNLNIINASGVNDALDGLGKSATKGYLNQTAGNSADAHKALNNKIITSIPEAIGKIIGAGLAFIGLLFFLLIIYGGFLWMTARGNEAQVTKSIDLMTQAVLGLLIVAGAYLLTKFIGQTIIGGM